MVLAVILALGIVPVGAVPSIGGPTQTTVDDGPSIAAAETPEADTTVTRIAIDENGTAHWSVTVRTRLENDSDVDDYEAFQERFRADRESYVDEFERRMTGVVSNAANSTGRSMTASDFRAETSIQEVPRRWGTVTYSFRWTNFGALDGSAVVVGDVFEGGLYLDADDRLRIVPPTGYEPTETSPQSDEIDGTTAVWVGPENFADRQPTVRFEPSESAVDSDTDGATRWTALPFVIGGGIVLLAVLGIAVSVAFAPGVLHRAHSRIPAPIGRATESTETATAESDDVADTSTEDGDTGGRNGSGEPADPSAADASSVPADLATDEDRVRALLERNDGRMRQAAIAEELDWSASKTSRVVSGMADENAVEKLRIGRENVIDLLEESD